MAERTALEHWLEPITAALGGAARAQLARRLARDLRSRQARRIAAQQNPDGSPYARRQPRKRQTTQRLADKAGRIRRTGKMFSALRSQRFLLARADAKGLSVGFSGRIADLARIHQQGELALVAPNGPLYQYPARRLLGWSDDDQAWLIEQVRQHLENTH